MIICLFFSYISLLTFAQPTLRPTPGVVGTAFAPTLSEGKCINLQDYTIWTTADGNGKTGFDKVPDDLEACSSRCSFLLQFDSQSAEYSCGGLFQKECDVNIYALCVSDCMARDPKLTSRPNFPQLQTGPYTPGCASCFGNVSYCVTETCLTTCAVGGSESFSCKLCAQDNCDPGFQSCSGLDFRQNLPVPENFVGIAIGAAAGGVFLLTSAIFIGYCNRMRSKNDAFLTMAELEVLSKKQSKQSIAFIKSSSSSNSRKGDGFNYVSPTDSFVNNPQYFSGNNKIEQSPPQLPKPSVTLTSLASSSANQLMSLGPGIPLIVLWSFGGEHEDDLNVIAGERIMGLKREDDWWLAKSATNQIGLIPVSYCRNETIKQVESTFPKNQVIEKPSAKPSERMSTLQATYSVTAAAKLLKMPTTKLMVLHDFVAEQGDELSCTAGTIVLGLHEQDGWYLVRRETETAVGLIPSSFVQKIISTAFTSDTEPNF